MFLPDISKNMLITLQNKEQWISDIIKVLLKNTFHQNFYMNNGVLFRKFLMANHIMATQIVLPMQLGEPLISRFHSHSFFKHMGAKSMNRHLQPIFYIKNFYDLATRVISDCIFCQYNKSYPNRKLLPGHRLLVDGPRKFIHMDICTINTGSRKYDSFLTVVYALCNIFAGEPLGNSLGNCGVASHWVGKIFWFPILSDDRWGIQFF